MTDLTVIEAALRECLEAMDNLSETVWVAEGSRVLGAAYLNLRPALTALARVRAREMSAEPIAEPISVRVCCGAAHNNGDCSIHGLYNEKREAWRIRPAEGEK